MELEDPATYNERCRLAVGSFVDASNSMAIVGKGRTAREKSLILVERGKFRGFGFLDRSVELTDFQGIKDRIKPGVETPTIQNLVNSYRVNPRGAQVVVYQ